MEAVKPVAASDEVAMLSVVPNAAKRDGAVRKQQGKG